jgi:hypothetical protein
LSALEALIARIRGEYCEMPGLRLTLAQACRLWQVDSTTCQPLLEQLVREGFLYQTTDGAYLAASTAPKRQVAAVSHPRSSLPIRMNRMATSAEMCWLFTRGTESVRLVREHEGDACRLVVYGPESEVTTYEFAGIIECMKRQAGIEQCFQSAGYHLARTSDRRGTRGAWQGPARRRGDSRATLPTLFWSRRGEVACAAHAPDASSERWHAEGWGAVREPGSRRRLAYQCSHCAVNGRPHRRVGRQPAISGSDLSDG